MFLCCVRERERERVRRRAHADVNKWDDITRRFHDKPAEGPLPLPPPRRLSFPAVKWCSTLLLLLHATTRLWHDHVISGPRWAPPPLRDDSHRRLSAFSTPVNGPLLTLKTPITHSSREILQHPAGAFIAERENQIICRFIFLKQMNKMKFNSFSQILKWIKEPINKTET